MIFLGKGNEASSFPETKEIKGKYMQTDLFSQPTSNQTKPETKDLMLFWFCLNDICEILELSNTSQVKSTLNLDAGRNQSTNIEITGNGLIKLNQGVDDGNA